MNKIVVLTNSKTVKIYDDMFIVPIKQEAWYLQIKEQISTSKKPMDVMSIADILELYRQKKFLCDSCGNELGKCDYSLEEHITHMLNPSVLWCCENCFQKDLRNNTLIGITEESNFEQWRIDLK